MKNGNTHVNNKNNNTNFIMSFSYGRALQQAALKSWQGKPENSIAAQEAFNHRAIMNKKANILLFKFIKKLLI